MKQSGLSVTEEIRERIKAKNNKIRRYQSTIKQYQQSRTFKNNQRKFYWEFNIGQRNYEGTEVHDKKDTGIFGEYLGERKEDRKDAKWLKNSKRDFEYKEKQEEIEISPEKIKKMKENAKLRSAWS